jgi:hypothetical protein
VVSFSSPPKTLTHSPKGEIRRHDDAASLVSLGEPIEEQLAASAVERHEPELVEDEQIDLLQSSRQASELARVARFEERPHDVGGAREEDASLLPRALDAECDREMRFAGADGPREDDVIGARSIRRARAQRFARAGGAIGGGEVEGVECLELGELRFANAVTHGGSVREVCSAESTSWRYSSYPQCSSRACLASAS